MLICVVHNANYKEFKHKAKSRLDKYYAEIDKNYKIDKVHMLRKAQLMLPFINGKLILPLYIASKGKYFIRKR